MASKKFKSGLAVLIVIVVLITGVSVFSVVKKGSDFAFNTSNNFGSVKITKTTNKTSRPHSDYIGIN